jgi:hypothetical protein
MLPTPAIPSFIACNCLLVLKERKFKKGMFAMASGEGNPAYNPAMLDGLYAGGGQLDVARRIDEMDRRVLHATTPGTLALTHEVDPASTVIAVETLQADGQEHEESPAQDSIGGQPIENVVPNVH